MTLIHVFNFKEKNIESSKFNHKIEKL